jgi:hypothetical protein
MLARHADPKATQESPYPWQLPLDEQATPVSPLESALAQVLILMTFKSLRMNTYEKPGGGWQRVYGRGPAGSSPRRVSSTVDFVAAGT